MGRWLASLCSEEKNSEKPLNRTDKTDKTLSGEVLLVLSVPSSGISEKFSAPATVRRPLPHELQKLPKKVVLSVLSVTRVAVFLELIGRANPMKLEQRKGMAMGRRAGTSSRCLGAPPNPKAYGSFGWGMASLVGRGPRRLRPASRWQKNAQSPSRAAHHHQGQAHSSRCARRV
jgi:hypothetical protein